MSMTIIETMHIETDKEINAEEVTEDLERILADNGYRLVGSISQTIIQDANLKSFRTAWKDHYKSLSKDW